MGDEPTARFTEDDGVEVTAFLRGGGGVLRIGPRLRLVVRFSLPPGLHIYGEPVPDGMIATSVEVEGPEGFRCEAIERPPTEPFRLPGVEATMHVWEGVVDFVIPVFGNSDLARFLRHDPSPSIALDIRVRHQACDDAQCFIPRTRTIELKVPVGAGTMPGFEVMKAMGGDTIDMDSEQHMQRLVARLAARTPTRR